MQITNKIFIHGAAPGIGALFEELAANNIPFGSKSISNVGFAQETARLKLAHPHLPITTLLRWPVLGPDGFAFDDTFRYELPPHESIDWYWENLLGWTIQNRAQELSADERRHITIEIGNELRMVEAKDEVMPTYGGLDPIEYNARVMHGLVDMVLASGFKAAMFGFNAGEPRLGAFLEYPAMRSLVTRAGQSRGRIAFTFHEGFLRPDKPFDYWKVAGPGEFYPYTIGRWRQLMYAAQALNVPMPETHISEFAWAPDFENYSDLGDERARADMLWLMEHAYHDLPGYIHIYSAEPSGSHSLNLTHRIRNLLPIIRELTLGQRWDTHAVANPFNYSFTLPDDLVPPRDGLPRSRRRRRPSRMPFSPDELWSPSGMRVLTDRARRRQRATRWRQGADATIPPAGDGPTTGSDPAERRRTA